MTPEALRVIIRADAEADITDAAVRAYYQDAAANTEDEAWAKCILPESHRAWDED